MKRKGGAQADVALLEAAVGHMFRDKKLAGEALTHASRSNEMPALPCNERLEFLGDAVLGLIVGSYLYSEYPEMPEGRMTFVRAAVVSEPPLAHIAEEIGLPDMIRLGRGMRNSGEKHNPTILSDTIEAIIGALYLDAGVEAARTFILPKLKPGIEAAAVNGFVADKKSRLQNLLQKNGEIRIEYILDETTGKPPDQTFVVSVYADGKKLAGGSGKSKKDAQQEAAGNALAALLKADKKAGT